MKTTARVLAALACLATSLPAHAAEWWFVNVRDGRQPTCIKVNDTPQKMEDGMRRLWGEANVRRVSQPVHAGGDPRGKLLGQLYAVAVDAPEGTAQYPFTTSHGACLAAAPRVYAAEVAIEQERREIAAGTRRSDYRPPAEPWYVAAHKLGQCVALSDGFPGANTPQQLAAQFEGYGQRTKLRQGDAEGVYVLFTGGDAIAMVQGADRCKIVMALSAGR